MATYRPIPEGTVEIQTGLWVELHTFTVGDRIYSRYNIYSAEGYCFYQLSQPENYDEEGNLKPENERVYATYMSCAINSTLDVIKEDCVSVIIKEDYEIV